MLFVCRLLCVVDRCLLAVVSCSLFAAWCVFPVEVRLLFGVIRLLCALRRVLLAVCCLSVVPLCLWFVVCVCNLLVVC